MSSLKNRLIKTISAISKNDRELTDELNEVRKDNIFRNEAEERATNFESLNTAVPELIAPEGEQNDIALETIVLRVGRPVLTIFRDEALLDFRDAESRVWKERLLSVKQQLVAATRAVGRIELEHDPLFEWVGTGWLIDESIVVTNRHVAQVFGKANGQDFIFRQGTGGQRINASIDFLEEANRPDDLTFRVIKILHIENDGGADMALLRVEPSGANVLPTPISLAPQLPAANDQVAVIGYPARDSRIPDQQLMLDIFGDVYDKKRLAPGQVISSSETSVLHDCSTLGGNSGSVVLDLASGRAVGLHFAGRFLESNFSVPAAIIHNRLNRFNRVSPSAMKLTKPAISDQEVSAGDNNTTNGSAPLKQNDTTIEVPLIISISIGNISSNGAARSTVSVNNLSVASES